MPSPKSKGKEKSSSTKGSFKLENTIYKHSSSGINLPFLKSKEMERQSSDDENSKSEDEDSI